MSENLRHNPNNMNWPSSSSSSPPSLLPSKKQSGFSSSSSSSPPSHSIEFRLKEVKKAVQKATEEAFQRTDPAMVLESGSDNPNASFHLGMELFGSMEPAQMERSIQEHLVQLEQKLQTVVHAMQQQQLLQEDMENNNELSEMEEGSPAFPSAAASAAPVQLDANVLRFKLDFLKQCSQIRQSIDEAIALADPLYASTTSTTSTTIDGGSTIGGSTSSSGEMDLVQSMRKLLEAEKAWNHANQGLLEFCGNNINDDTTQSETAMATTNEEQRELQKCRDMMEWLRQDIRHPKVELISQIQTLWQNCVTLESETMFVRGFQKRSNSNSSTSSAPPLEQVYGVLQVLEEEQGHSLQKEILLPFAARLYEQVLGPVLEGHNKQLRRQVPVRWQFHELQERGASSTLLSSSVVMSSSSSSWSSSLGTAKSLEWNRDENDQDTADLDEDVIAAWKETFYFLQRILVFVAEHVFLGRPELCRLLGKRLLGRPQAVGVDDRNELGTTSSAFQLIGKDDGVLMEPLVEFMMDTCLPDYVAPPNEGDANNDEEGLVQQLRQYQSRLEAVVGPFLETMQHHGLLAEDLSSTTTTGPFSPDSKRSNHSCRLREFVQNFLPHYIDHRHGLLLDEARSLILHKKDFHNTQPVGVDPSTVTNEEDKRLGLDPGLDIFLLHQSCVSETALALFELCVACMDESVDCAKALMTRASSPVDHALDDLPATLYQAARQVLDLYRAIVPVRYGKEIAQVPRTAAIFYSDCVYLAHHCHALGLKYRDKYPEDSSSSSISADLRRVCIFVDKVPLFRDMADRCMRDMLDRQSRQVQELVRPRIPLLSKALRSTEIVAEWADAETALNAALYHLQHLAQQWKPVLSQQTFHSALGYLAHVLFTLFLEPVLAAPIFSTDACEFVHNLFGTALDRVQVLLQLSFDQDNVEKVVPTWNRLKAVGLFMDMTLNDVEAALSQGLFASVTGQELSHLLSAVFDDSPRQKELLKLVKQQ
ncbi:hypothetical protein ACA910_021893 [Epithemia clementina (nom. ined.)]